MPIVHFHLASDLSTPVQRAELVQRACQTYAYMLQAPIDRTRAFIHLYAGSDLAVGGCTVADQAVHAPFFEFLVLAGRAAEQRTALMLRFTDLLEEVLGVPRAVIRGCCRQVDPEDWSIAGMPASAARRDEIAARSQRPT